MKKSNLMKYLGDDSWLDRFTVVLGIKNYIYRMVIIFISTTVYSKRI